jgi:N-formylglutamate amidohydrolase
VDELYAEACARLRIPLIAARWHRYVVDLNRVPSDIDGQSVLGAEGQIGKEFVSGFHWVRTTRDEVLMPSPMTMELHERFVESYWRPFHQDVLEQFAFRQKQGFDQVYHLDVHSMPSLGTAKHLDPGQKRPQIVVSDLHGRSCAQDFCGLVVEAYEAAGFEVRVNWPYQGGRITQTYGQPLLGHHTVQVEMSRAIYMDEESRKKRSPQFSEVKAQLFEALNYIHAHI